MQENDYSLYDYIKPILTGSLISLISIGVLTFIVSLAMTKVDLPFGFISPIAIFILGFSTLLGSFISSKGFGKKGFFLGLSISIAIFIILLLVNLSFEPDGFGTIAAVKGAVTLICGILGGVMGVNSKKSAKFKI